jgi:DNA-binding winged helix-turn-helix (wHTH) protein
VASTYQLSEERPERSATTDSASLHFEGFVLDVAGRTLLDVSGNDVPLRRSEFELLLAFVGKPGRALSHDYLLNVVSGRHAEVYDRSIDILVGRLRRKIEPEPAKPRLILTVPGIGYKFAAKPCLHAAMASTTPESAIVQRTSEALPLPDKPSIAVLAFTNMSVDPEQEYFSDVIADDIITELSRSRSLFVIAHNSSFAYKGHAIDVKQIGDELTRRRRSPFSAVARGILLNSSTYLTACLSWSSTWTP